MKFRFIPALFIAALALPVAALAQEHEHEMKDESLVQVMTWEIAPDQTDEWEAVIKEIVDAAKAANLGHDYGWTFYSKNNDYTLIYPIANYAYFDDPMQWMRQFEGTEGNEALQAAMAKFPTIDHRVVNEMISVHKMDWSYIPGDMADLQQKMMDHRYVEVFEFSIRPGKNEEFGEIIKEYMTFFKEIGYSYPIMGHDTKFGQSGRAVFVTMIDDLSDFYGENNFEATVAKANATERMQELWTKLTLTITDWDQTIMRHHPELQYWGEPALATN